MDIGWFVNIIVNFLDFVMFYFLCNNLINRKAKISFKIIILGISYGMFLGNLGNFLDGNTTRVVTTVTMILFLKLISKSKIYNVLILYVVIFLSVTAVQVPTYLIVSSFALQISNVYSTFLVQIFTVIIILFICTKIPLYKLIDKIEKELLLKLLVFTATVITLSMFFYFNFEYTTSYILYFSLLIAITFVGLYHTLKKIFFYTNTVPVQLHDIKNFLMGIHISSYYTNDINDIRRDINRILNIMDMDSSIGDYSLTDQNQSIISFIDKKKSKGLNNDVKFITNIGYYEPNAKVTLSEILYMLGVLIDNAIETGTRKAIIVQVSVIEESLFISVANEYQRKSVDDFNKMFEEKYSTKGNDATRGYGLPNLSKIVTSYGGDILLKEEYKTDQKSNYLIVSIKISSYKKDALD